MHNDRQLGHSHVMASLPPGLGTSPRSAAGVLWHIDPRTQHLTVRYPSVPAGVTNLGVVTSLASVDIAERMRIALSINCQKTPPARLPQHLHDAIKAEGKAYRSRMVIVPKSDRPDWIARRLSRIGFEIEQESLTISKLYSAQLGPRRRGRIPAVDVTATGTVVDAEAFGEALAGGIGKGKNFGLGLIRTSTALTSQGAQP
nr:type I-E CRISPR-associated protein Cas6/Cse3/CasE [Gordonia humi]